MDIQLSEKDAEIAELQLQVIQLTQELLRHEQVSVAAKLRDLREQIAIANNTANDTPVR